MHIHLDLVGGISGDMFNGAMLNCFPGREPDLEKVMVAAGFSDLVRLECGPANDGVLTGTRFKVLADTEAHHHRHYSEIKQILKDSVLSEPTRDAALAIFEIIAIAEAEIHGKDVDSVAFHEVGAWDSIADIVCAAYLITDTGVTSWSVSKIPIGRGQVKTAHGMLPIPAPATSLILQEFEFFDDQIEGERVTPTGAAILKYLTPAKGIPGGVTLRQSATGFGTKMFPGISNVVRVLLFDRVDAPVWDTDEVLQLEFEVDDQTPEALAAALDQVRAESGVLDVLQIAYFGKKGRQGTSVRVLLKPEMEVAVTELCFVSTTTLGIRKQLVSRAKLRREESVINHAGQDFRVKVSDRPRGKTAKVDMDDLQTVSITLREETRRKIEGQALSYAESEKDGEEK